MIWDSSHPACLKRGKCSSRVPNVQIGKRTGVTDIGRRLTLFKSNWMGHVGRRKNERWIKVLLKWQPPLRSIGWPPTYLHDGKMTYECRLQRPYSSSRLKWVAGEEKKSSDSLVHHHQGFGSKNLFCTEILVYSLYSIRNKDGFIEIARATNQSRGCSAIENWSETNLK